MNRVTFACQFHDQPATGRLTLDDDGTFLCCFKLDDARVLWPFHGRWTRVNDTILLVTPHRFAEVVLRINPDLTLSYVSHHGGFIRWDLVGVRSTALSSMPQEAAHA